MKDIFEIDDIANRLGVLFSEQDKVSAYQNLSNSQEADKRRKEWQDDPAYESLVPELRNVREILLPAALAAEQRQREIATQWSDIFKREHGYTRINPLTGEEGNHVWDVFELRTSSPAQLRVPRGVSVRDNGVGQRIFRYMIDPNEFSLSLKLHGDKIEDNSHLEEFVNLAGQLSNAVLQSEEILHADVFNCSHVYNPVICGDGKPLLSNCHDLIEGKFSNRLDFDLSEAALERAVIAARNLLDISGNKLFVRPKLLIVPIELQYVAHRILEGTAGSSIYPEDGYRVLDYLNNPRSWFLQTTIPGLRSVWWQPYRLDIDIEGNDLIITASEVFGCGHTNPRSVIGSLPKE